MDRHGHRRGASCAQIIGGPEDGLELAQSVVDPCGRCTRAALVFKGPVPVEVPLVQYHLAVVDGGPCEHDCIAREDREVLR